MIVRQQYLFFVNIKSIHLRFVKVSCFLISKPPYCRGSYLQLTNDLKYHLQENIKNLNFYILQQNMQRKVRQLFDLCFLVGTWSLIGKSWKSLFQFEDYSKVLVGEWADPGGTAMPGQPVTEPEQAPELSPLTKISLISKGAHGPRIRY